MDGFEWVHTERRIRNQLDQVCERLSICNRWRAKRTDLARYYTLCMGLENKVRTNDKVIPLRDNEDPGSKLVEAVLHVEFQIEHTGKHVLVFCTHGRSRSGAVVVGYLMRSRGWTYEQALGFARCKRPYIQPCAEFEENLKLYFDPKEGDFAKK